MSELNKGIVTRFAVFDAYFRSEKQPLVSENWRFFGFVNDVGEALHSFLPKSLYLGSYAVTGIYAVGAVYYDRQRMNDKLEAGEPFTKAQQNNKKMDYTPEEKSSILNRRTANNSVFHLLATIAITPLLVIPAVKAGTRRLLMNVCMPTNMKEKIIPAIFGILSIPAVVSPVDNAVNYVMNEYNDDLPPESYHWSGYWSFMNKH